MITEELTKEEVAFILEDNQRFKQEIINTQGAILLLVQLYDIDYEEEVLLQDPDVMKWVYPHLKRKIGIQDVENLVRLYSYTEPDNDKVLIDIVKLREQTIDGVPFIDILGEDFFKDNSIGFNDELLLIKNTKLFENNPILLNAFNRSLKQSPKKPVITSNNLELLTYKIILNNKKIDKSLEVALVYKMLFESFEDSSKEYENFISNNAHNWKINLDHEYMDYTKPLGEADIKDKMVKFYQYISGQPMLLEQKGMLRDLVIFLHNEQIKKEVQITPEQNAIVTYRDICNISKSELIEMLSMMDPGVFKTLGPLQSKIYKECGIESEDILNKVLDNIFKVDENLKILQYLKISKAKILEAISNQYGNWLIGDKLESSSVPFSSQINQNYRFINALIDNNSTKQKIKAIDVESIIRSKLEEKIKNKTVNVRNVVSYIGNIDNIFKYERLEINIKEIAKLLNNTKKVLDQCEELLGNDIEILRKFLMKKNSDYYYYPREYSVLKTKLKELKNNKDLINLIENVDYWFEDVKKFNDIEPKNDEEKKVRDNYIIKMLEISKKYDLELQIHTYDIYSNFKFINELFDKKLISLAKDPMKIISDCLQVVYETAEKEQNKQKAVKWLNDMYNKISDDASLKKQVLTIIINKSHKSHLLKQYFSKEILHDLENYMDHNIRLPEHILLEKTNNEITDYLNKLIKKEQWNLLSGLIQPEMFDMISNELDNLWEDKLHLFKEIFKYPEVFDSIRKYGKIKPLFEDYLNWDDFYHLKNLENVKVNDDSKAIVEYLLLKKEDITRESIQKLRKIYPNGHFPVTAKNVKIYMENDYLETWIKNSNFNHELIVKILEDNSYQPYIQKVLRFLEKNPSIYANSILKIGERCHGIKVKKLEEIEFNYDILLDGIEHNVECIKSEKVFFTIHEKYIEEMNQSQLERLAKICIAHGIVIDFFTTSYSDRNVCERFNELALNCITFEDFKNLVKIRSERCMNKDVVESVHINNNYTFDHLISLYVDKFSNESSIFLLNLINIENNAKLREKISKSVPQKEVFDIDCALYHSIDESFLVTCRALAEDFIVRKKIKEQESTKKLVKTKVRKF